MHLLGLLGRLRLLCCDPRLVAQEVVDGLRRGENVVDVAAAALSKAKASSVQSLSDSTCPLLSEDAKRQLSHVSHLEKLGVSPKC